MRCKAHVKCSFEMGTAVSDIPCGRPKGQDNLIMNLGNTRYLCCLYDDVYRIGVQRSHCPLSVLHINPGMAIITRDWLELAIESLRKDDIFNPYFLSSILFICEEGQEFELQSEAINLLEDEKISWLSGIQGRESGYKSAAAGPALLSNSKLWQVLKLYDDSFSAFMIALQPNCRRHSSSETYQYKKLDVAGERYQTVSISVPSRLAFRASSKQAPLAGLRFAVKDLYRMNGLKTSLCNQAYLDVSDQADYTASAVAAFTRAGAQILGMTKLSSLISREEPTEGIDYQIPFNPRGDGYQSPAGSSNGSAAAVAAYDWLDFSLGTDTSGSGRRPALANGVFQLRPTHDAINLDGIVPTFLPWDTPCLFSRDVAMIKQLASVWYISDMPPTKFHKPPAIIYPLDYFPVPNPAQMIIIEGFISDLEKHLGITISKVSLSSLWDIAPPQEAGQQSVKDYLRSTVVNTYYHDFYHSTDNFRAKYRSIYKKEPYVTPFNQWRWNLGKRVSPSQNESGLHQLSVYKRWFLDVVMKRETHESLLLLPVANVEPNYRDSTPPEPIIQHGFDPLFIPPILGSPDLFVPLDDSEYMSRVSGKKEFLPVGIDLVGTPGADLTLIETVQGCLTVSGRSTQVLTGARMFGPCH